MTIALSVVPFIYGQRQSIILKLLLALRGTFDFFRLFLTVVVTFSSMKRFFPTLLLLEKIESRFFKPRVLHVVDVVLHSSGVI